LNMINSPKRYLSYLGKLFFKKLNIFALTVPLGKNKYSVSNFLNK